MISSTSVSAGQVLIAGEILRMRFHAEVDLIKDRRYHFRSYSSCIVGRDAVDWLVKTKEAQSRKNAVRCMRLLQDQGVLHHVCEDHMFKDEYLFYRFRFDDGTFFVEPELLLYHQGITAYQSMSQDNHIITINTCNGETFGKSINGKMLIDWTIDNDYVSSREDGVVFGQHLIDIGLLNQVHNEVVFYDDEDILYQFVFDESSQPPLFEALGLKHEETDYHHSLLDDDLMRLGISPGQKNFMKRLWSGSDASYDDDSMSIASSPESGGGQMKPVVFRQMSAEELTHKTSPYIYKSIRVVSDAVGFGFVVRGEGPCYIQTVDPTGPGCRAGLKVRQFIFSVNGKNCLQMSHKEIAHEIMQGPMVDLVVLEHYRSKT